MLTAKLTYEVEKRLVDGEPVEAHIVTVETREHTFQSVSGSFDAAVQAIGRIIKKAVPDQSP